MTQVARSVDVDPGDGGAGMPDSAEVLAAAGATLAANREPGRKEVLETLHQAIGLAGGAIGG